MNKSNNKFVVIGEASESEDEEIATKPAFRRDNIVAQCVKPIVAGEASESDYDSDDYYNVAAAFESRKQENSKKKSPKYNSLLHKKLREDNWKLREGLENFICEVYNWGSGEVSKVNQQLLTAQVQLQDAAISLRKSSIQMTRLNAVFDSMAGVNFMPNVNTAAFPYLRSTF